MQYKNLNLKLTVLTVKNYQRAKFFNCNLTGADLTGVNLEESKFLDSSILKEIVGASANFQQAVLRNINLSCSEL